MNYKMKGDFLMKYLRKPIALLLALIMVMLVIPTAMLSAFASVNPVAKATLITAPIYTEYKTDPSPDGRGWESSPRGFYFEPIVPLNSVGEEIAGKYGNHNKKDLQK